MSDCSLLLRDGLFEYDSLETDTERIAAFSHWLRDRRYAFLQDSSGTDLSVSIPSLLTLGFGHDQERWSEFWSDIESHANASEAVKARLLSHSRKVNEELAKTYVSCLSQFGLHAWVETTSDPMVFALAMQWKTPGEPASALIESIDVYPTPADTSGGIAAGTAITAATARMRITRATAAAVLITIKSNMDVIGGSDLRLPPVAPVEDDKPVHVGTIDVVLCSGADAELPHIRAGVAGGSWQVCTWQSSRAATRSLGPQLQLPPSLTELVFGKTPATLQAGQVSKAVISCNWVITDNVEQAQFFDLDGLASSYFDWADGGRFYFYDSYQGSPNHHIRLLLTISMRQQS